MTRDAYRQSLIAMPDAELLAHGVSVYLTARRSRGAARAYNALDIVGDECYRRDGVQNGPLWMKILAGVVAEEAKVRESNRRALERLRATSPETDPQTTALQVEAEQTAEAADKYHLACARADERGETRPPHPCQIVEDA